MLRIRHLNIHRLKINYFKNASPRRYLSYYNSDNKNNEENYTNPANVITPGVPNNLQTDKLSSIENKIDWMLILTFPTWIWTIGMSIYKLLH